MNFVLQIPLPTRLAIVFALGVLAGTQVNHFIYRLAHHRRLIGPWMPRDPKAPPRSWFDFLPIVGWFTLRREAKIHGAGFWLRPLMIELMLGVGLAMLYSFELDSGLRPDWLKLPRLPVEWIHAQFFAHALLILLMTTASFIDVDEKLIPDEITVYGALLGLLLAVLLPFSHLPDWIWLQVPPGWTNANLLHVTSPRSWQPWLSDAGGLVAGLLCFLAWWLAIIPWTWTLRRGPGRATSYALASLRRRIWPRAKRPREGWRGYPVILLLGLVGIGLTWALRGSIGLDRWQALVSSLVGMVAGGGLVWAVRIVGSRALGMEAMGFGDVTLVAMIGTFLGWQSCLFLFFIAPFPGAIIALLHLLITWRQEIWFGPFLCLGALLTVLFWAWLWNRFEYIFSMGLLVPALFVVALALMWAMLTIWRFFKENVIFRQR